FTGSFGVQPNTNANVRFDADFFRSANGLLKLFQLFDNNDNRLAKFAPKQRNTNESRIFVTVADDQAFRILVHGERSDEFRFAAGFQSEVKLQAGIDNLFDDFPQLVDLDRENAAIFIAITELRHRGLKGAINRFDAVPEQILKPDYQRKAEPTVASFVYNFENVDATAVFLEWTRLDVPGGVDGKVTATPSLHIVSGDSGLNVPLGF